MNLSNFEPYEKSYKLSDIKSGLKFYYKLIDQFDPLIFTEEKFPITRSEIITTLKYLDNIPPDHYVNNLTQSHPILSQAIESIENFNNKNDSDTQFEYQKNFIIVWLENLLFSGCFVLYHKFQLDYQTIIKEKNADEIIKLLIENRANIKTNSESYSRRYLKLVFEFIEVEIEKNSAMKTIDSDNLISNEASELIKDYLNQIKNNEENNNLNSSLQKHEYDKFIYKLKRLLFIPSYYDITKDDREKAFHVYLLGVLQGRLDSYHIKTNKESGLGRYDICLNPIDKRNPGIIIEIKKIEESLDQNSIDLELNAALDQIDQKQYFFDLSEDGVVNIIKIALVFNGLEPNLKWIKKNNECEQKI